MGKMTNDEITQLSDDALRVEVAKRWGREWCRDFDIPAALALLDSMTYQDGVSVEYNIFRWAYKHVDDIHPLPAPVYQVTIFGRNPVNGQDYDASGDTLARSACRAWLAWHDALSQL